MTSVLDQEPTSLLVALVEGDFQVNDLPPDQARTLALFINGRRNQLLQAGYSLPVLAEKPTESAIADYLARIIDLSDHQNRGKNIPPSIDGERPFDKDDHRHHLGQFFSIYRRQRQPKGQRTGKMPSSPGPSPFSLI